MARLENYNGIVTYLGIFKARCGRKPSCHKFEPDFDSSSILLVYRPTNLYNSQYQACSLTHRDPLSIRFAIGLFPSAPIHRVNRPTI